MSILASILNNMLGQSLTEPTPEDNPEQVKEQTAETTNAVINREPLEWSFIDFTKAERCPVFDVDPVTLKKFIGHNVTVVNRSRTEYHGCCLAIDPVSLSVILATRGDAGAIRVTTLPGYSLLKIKVDSDSVPPENTISVNDLDVAELYHAPSLYTETTANYTSKQTSTSGSSSPPVTSSKATNESPITTPVEKEGSPPPPSLSPEEVRQRKEKLVELLSKHRMPVIVKDEILELPGGIKISPPYTLEDCTTGNQIIKKKIGELILSL